MKNYYEILEVSKTATAWEIKRQYRRLANKFHPDKNADPFAEERFKEIAEAYECLSDPVSRAAYDNNNFHKPTPPAPAYYRPRTTPASYQEPFPWKYAFGAVVFLIVGITFIVFLVKSCKT
jgi:curved DNA-binding protein CbpA